MKMFTKYSKTKLKLLEGSRNSKMIELGITKYLLLMYFLKFPRVVILLVPSSNVFHKRLALA